MGGRDKRSERLIEGRTAFTIGEHEDAFEEDLVEEFPQVVRRDGVCARAVLQQIESEFEGLFGREPFFGVALRLTLVLSEGCCDAVLFALEQVEGNGVGIMGLEKAVLFAFESFAFGGQPFDRCGGFSSAFVELVSNGIFCGGSNSWGEDSVHLPVTGFDLCLDLIHED